MFQNLVKLQSYVVRSEGAMRIRYGKKPTVDNIQTSLFFRSKRKHEHQFPVINAAKSIIKRTVQVKYFIYSCTGLRAGRSGF